MNQNPRVQQGCKHSTRIRHTSIAIVTPLFEWVHLPHSSGLNGVEQKAALQALADQARARFGVPFTSDVLREADPSATCNEALERYFAAHDIELVIMSSHPPRVSDHWLPSHGQWLAAHSARSLLLLR